MADPDQDMFLRLIQQQLKESQQGNIQNEMLLKSLNRPTTIDSPFKTETIPGNAGAFASPMALGTNQSSIPKTSMQPQTNLQSQTSMPPPMSPKQPPMMPPNRGMPQQIDPRLQNSPYSIPEILKALMGMQGGLNN